MPLNTDEEWARHGDLVLVALLAMHNDDEAAADEALVTIARDYDWKGLYAAVLQWNRMINKELFSGPVSEVPIGIVGIGRDTGAWINAEETGASIEVVTATRIFAATANDDQDAAGDFFAVAVEHGYAQHVVTETLTMAAALLGPSIDRRLALPEGER